MQSGAGEQTFRSEICPDAVKASRQQPDVQSAFFVQVGSQVMSPAHA
jgi:hypothetical protein